VVAAASVLAESPSREKGSDKISFWLKTRLVLAIMTGDGGGLLHRVQGIRDEKKSHENAR